MKSPVQSFYNWYRSVLRNSRYRWLIVGGTLLYLLSPLDISPDFIPIVGWIDDGVLVTLLVAEISQIAVDFLKAHQKRQPLTDPDVLQEPVIDVEVQS